MEVTDHAVVRYMERALGIDVQMLRSHIQNELSTRALEAAAKIGGRHEISHRGLRYIFRDKKLITIIKK